MLIFAQTKNRMEPIRNLDQLVARLKSGGRKWNVVVACADDAHSIFAISHVLKEGIARFTFIGCQSPIDRFPELAPYVADLSFRRARTADEAARTAVAMARNGEADVLMKGLINTDVLLHALLDKTNGLLPRGNLMTLIAMAKLPTYNKLLFFSDPAVIPNPTLEQRVQIIDYTVGVCRHFGIEEPRVALIHCTEKVSERFPVTIDYRKIVEMAQAGRFGKALVDGPLDLKTACQQESADIKGIRSDVAGKADALILPEIESGNLLYKTLTLFSEIEVASLLMGTCKPVVVTSRSDAAISKYHSLLMGLQLANNK